MREYQLYIGGGWRPGQAGTAPAVSPSSGETFARVAVGGPADVDAAVSAAAAAWPAWAAASPFDRALACEQVAAAVLAARDDLADVLTRDQGKPLAESLDEVDELAVYFRMAGEDAKRVAGSLPASTSAGRRVLTARVPLGVVGVISPWNWPYTMGAEILAPALAAGNTVVWVPAPTTTACCSVLTEVIARGRPARRGVQLRARPRAGGRRRAGRAPGGGRGRLRRLGGHRGQRRDPRPPARPSCWSWAATAPWSCWPTPMSSSRPRPRWRRPICAPARAAPPVSDSWSRRASELCLLMLWWPRRRRRCGWVTHSPPRPPWVRSITRPRRPSSTGTSPTPSRAGPGSAAAARRAGGFPTALYAEPTVLDGVTPGMLIEREETFGPVVPVVEVASAAQALELTNASPFGLTAAVFTADLERGLAFAERARAGWVNINASTNLWESHLPFGGRAGSISGHGRVGGRYPMETFTEPKTVVYPAPRYA